MILVVVEAAELERVSEALRAGIGLGLRGDDVAVVLTGPAARLAGGEEVDPRVARALRTLAELGRPARVMGGGELDAGTVDAFMVDSSIMGRVRAVEVWTSSDSGPRRLLVGGREVEVDARPPRFRSGGRAIDAAELVAQILGSDGPVVVR